MHGGGNALLAVTGTFTVTTVAGVGRVTRTDGVAWTTAGFAVGNRVNLPGYAVGAFTVTGFADGGCDAAAQWPRRPGRRRADGRRGPTSPCRSTTRSRRRPASSASAATTSSCSAARGPTSPLVIYGDTSQDGIWFSGDPTAQTGHLFGPKPTIQPVGNAPNYVFPVAAPLRPRRQRLHRRRRALRRRCRARSCRRSASRSTAAPGRTRSSAARPATSSRAARATTSSSASADATSSTVTRHQPRRHHPGAHRRHGQRELAADRRLRSSPATTCSSARASDRRRARRPARPTTPTSSSVTTASDPGRAGGAHVAPRRGDADASSPTTPCACSGCRPPSC